MKADPHPLNHKRISEGLMDIEDDDGYCVVTLISYTIFLL